MLTRTVAKDELSKLDVLFVSIMNEYIYMTSPYGKILMALFAGFAETERELLRERVKEGMAEAKEKGVHVGRPRTSHKYIDEVKRLFYDEEMSINAISKQIGIGYGSVYRIVTKLEIKKEGR